MGFMDKAKKMAEQAQAKLDEVQKDFNASGSSSPGTSGPVVEYDKHGRPITPSEPAAPQGDPTGAAVRHRPAAGPQHDRLHAARALQRGSADRRIDHGALPATLRDDAALGR